MPLIFVDTDNSKPNDKLYKAGKAGEGAAKAESRMQSVVKRIIDKSAGFTTLHSDKAKGYSIRLEISKLDRSSNQTKCTLSGEIVQYPRKSTLKRGEGEVMLSTSMSSSATADGTSEGSLLDAVEATAESLVTKSVPIMKADFLKR